MGLFVLLRAVPDASGVWSVARLSEEPDVDGIARKLAEEHSAALVCFVFDSDVAYAVAAGADGTGAQLVFNEPTAIGYGMDFLPFGRSAEAASDLAAWARAHAPKALEPGDARRILEAEHVFAEEGVAEIFELLGLTWSDDALQ
jgi:hypothetical protein